jgi:hypothetical protein
VEAGMQVLQEKKMIQFFRELAGKGKLIFGTSAGSILLCREWIRWKNPNDDSTSELFPCLGLVLLICDTHGEKDAWGELKAAIQLKGEGASGYGITSGACLKVYPHGRLEAENGPVAHFTLLKGKLERQADLLPVERISGTNTL